MGIPISLTKHRKDKVYATYIPKEFEEIDDYTVVGQVLVHIVEDCE